MCTKVVQDWTSLNQKRQEIAIHRISTDIATKQLELNEQATDFNTSIAAKIGQWTGIIGNVLKGSASISTSTVNVAK